jgi:superfamily II DNA or RNA helicase
VAGLRKALPSAALQAARMASDDDLADLALAVFGPTVLTKVADALAAAGLDPPRRWGSEAARSFVAEIGFPPDFAASASVRREGEIFVSGPIDLPPLHNYQEEILAALAALLQSGPGRRRAVVSLPTGGGKTRVAAEAVVKLVLNGAGPRTALWVAQTDELCEQAVQCFRQLWANVGAPDEDLRIVRLWGSQANPAAPEQGEAVVVVASIQTLDARAHKGSLAWLSRPGIVVIDECHHAIAPSYSSLLRWLDVQIGNEAQRQTEPPVIGLSATPWRGRDDDESARLATRFDRRWLPADQEGLYAAMRERGVLSELQYSPIHYDKPVSLSAADISHFAQYGELPDSVVEEIGRDPDRNDLIVERVLESAESSILLFANSVAHAQFLAARLHLAGCPAAAVSGETDRLARQYFIRRFRAGEIRVLCNHSVLTTGFDAPKSDMILISRPVFSPVRYMQMVGRGLRGPANGGTENCRIVTVEDNILSYRDRLAYHYCRQFFDSGQVTA